MLEEIKMSLGISSPDKDGLLTSLISRCSQPVINYIQETVIPPELEYIVIELAIARYNRIGSEGLKSENTDGVSFSYNDNLMDNYKYDLDIWIKKNSTQSSANVRMRLI